MKQDRNPTEERRERRHRALERKYGGDVEDRSVCDFSKGGNPEDIMVLREELRKEKPLKWTPSPDSASSVYLYMYFLLRARARSPQTSPPRKKGKAQSIDRACLTIIRLIGLKCPEDGDPFLMLFNLFGATLARQFIRPAIGDPSLNDELAEMYVVRRQAAISRAMNRLAISESKANSKLKSANGFLRAAIFMDYGLYCPSYWRPEDAARLSIPKPKEFFQYVKRVAKDNGKTLPEATLRTVEKICREARQKREALLRQLPSMSASLPAPSSDSAKGCCEIDPPPSLISAESVSFRVDIDCQGRVVRVDTGDPI